MADMRNTKAWMIAMTAAMAACAFAADVSLTTVGGDDITGNTLVVTGVSVEETDPTVPAWAKAAEPPAADVDAQEITNVATAVAGNVALAATNYTDAATNDILQEAKGYASGLLEGDIYPQNVMAGNSISGYSIGTATAQFGQVEINGDEWGEGGGSLVVNGTNMMERIDDISLTANEAKDTAIAAQTFAEGVSNTAETAYANSMNGLAAVATLRSDVEGAGYVKTNENGWILADIYVQGYLGAVSHFTVGQGWGYGTATIYGATTNHGPMVIGSEYYPGSLSVNGTNVMDAIAECARAEDISTNNPAFVAAVTNCPVVLTSGGNVDYGDFGQYGTVGALLAALAAAVVALRNAKVTTISAQSTDAQYPSAKCVWDIVGDVESALAAINGTTQSGNGGSGT